MFLLYQKHELSQIRILQLNGSKNIPLKIL